MTSSETERRLRARENLWQEAFGAFSTEGKAVLDAGTGEGHFTRFLASQRPARLVSVTCLKDEIAPAQSRLGELASAVEFHVGDLTRMPEIPDASFDIVGGDFLIAAVSSYTPYREIDCLRELCRVLRPGGRLVLTGWEVWPENRNRTEAEVRGLFKLREAIYHLLGEDPFREHPRFWVENRLADLDMPVDRICTIADIHRDFGWFFASVERALESLEPGELQGALAKRYDAHRQAIVSDPQIPHGFEFGRLYAVIACKLSGALLL